MGLAKANVKIDDCVEHFESKEIIIAADKKIFMHCSLNFMARSVATLLKRMKARMPVDIFDIIVADILIKVLTDDEPVEPVEPKRDEDSVMAYLTKLEEEWGGM